MQIDAATADLITAAVRRALEGAAKADPFMSAPEAAKELGIGIDQFRSLVRKNEIRFAIVGKRYKFTQQDLDEYRRKAREIPECRSSSRPARRTGITRSSIAVHDFLAERELRIAKKRKR